jgi:RNAse (barnase) inhibitor barstar
MDSAYTHEPGRRGMALSGTRGLHLYLRTLEAAVEDEIVTDEEMSILRVIAQAFALPEDVMGDAWDILRNNISNPINPIDVHAHEKRQIGDATTYQTALIAALVDEVITEDEWSMLDVMRRVMGIQSGEHALIEEAVRAMASNVEDSESFVSRLDRYVTLHPYR